MADSDGGAPEKTAEEIMKEQEAMLAAKYGGLKPKKKGLMAKEQKFFDSADWALNKEAASKHAPGQPPPPPPPEEQLKPKLEPTPIPTRRISHMESMDK